MARRRHIGAARRLGDADGRDKADHGDIGADIVVGSDTDAGECAVRVQRQLGIDHHVAGLIVTD